MYDTINMTLERDNAKGIDFLEEIPCYLEDVAEHIAHEGADVVLTGKLGGLCVSVNDHHVKVRNGSLCKWYMGDNYQTMKRSDAKMALDKLSDELHLPMCNAKITRLDYGTGIILKYPIDVYLHHLSVLNHFNRLEQPNSIYYMQANKQLCFYDKNKEQKSKQMAVPDLYIGRNVLRYEMRYTKRLPQMFGVPEVRACMLYDEAFYAKLLGVWKDNYNNIQKLNTTITNFSEVKTIKELKDIALHYYIMEHGGQTAMLKLIDDARKRGEIERKQAYDLRRAIASVSTIQSNEVCQNDAIEELNRKVVQAVKYYG